MFCPINIREIFIWTNLDNIRKHKIVTFAIHNQKTEYYELRKVHWGIAVGTTADGM